jgi:hypothetical protein
MRFMGADIAHPNGEEQRGGNATTGKTPSELTEYQ